MQQVNQDNWTRLIDADADECLSIYLPTESAGPQTRQNPIRFKNHLAQAQRLLAARGLSEATIDAMLAEGRSLTGDRQFWQHQRDGLAVFIDEQDTRLCRMMSPTPDLVALAPRFYVLPLVCELKQDATLYVLALSAGNVRLFRVTRRLIRPTEVRDMPRSLEESMASVENERSLQFHSGTARQGPPGSGAHRPATFHGQGTAGDEDRRNVRLHEFCRMIDACVVAALADERAPLMLAAAEPILSIFRSISSYPGLTEPSLAGNPEATPIDDLRQQALRAFEPMWHAGGLRAAEQYREHRAAGTTTDDLNQIVPATQDGRVQTLMVREHARRPGSYFEQDRLVETAEPGPNAEDLLNLAAVYTLRTSGEVHVMPGAEMPTGNDLAAILRY